MITVLRMSGIALVFCCLAAVAQSDSATAPSASDQASLQAGNSGKLDSIVFATGIKDRVPVGSSTQFGPQMQKVFCWTKLSIQHAPFKFKHIWYNGNEKVLEVPLRLGYASGRLWSYKTVTPGTWKVDVVDDAGKVLGSGTFDAK